MSLLHILVLMGLIWPSNALDPRDLQNGATIGNITSGYSDQPNCLVRRDGAWLCTVTYNDKPEGSAGEKVVTTISTDYGATWSPRYDVEPGQMLQHAYSTLFQGKGEGAVIPSFCRAVLLFSLNPISPTIPHLPT